MTPTPHPLQPPTRGLFFALKKYFVSNGRLWAFFYNPVAIRISNTKTHNNNKEYRMKTTNSPVRAAQRELLAQIEEHIRHLAGWRLLATATDLSVSAVTPHGHTCPGALEGDRPDACVDVWPTFWSADWDLELSASYQALGGYFPVQTAAIRSLGDFVAFIDRVHVGVA